MPALIVRAPGKAILCGEYAVLHGAPGIAVAVDRVVIASEGATPPKSDSPFVRAAMEHALRAGGAALDAAQVDSSALYENGEKLGLGSSAAVTAAVVGLSLAKAKRTLDPRTLFAIADAAHAEAQRTRGSGVDVACSVFGGAIRFQRRNGHVDVAPVDLPDDVRLTFVWTGQAASTGAFIERVKALAEAEPTRHQAAVGRLISHAHAFATAIADNEAQELVRAADAFGQAMAALGEAAGCDIVTKQHQLFAALARQFGGAAKPSGAGGGDLGVAFTIGSRETEALRAAARDAGLNLLSLGAPAPGLRLENA
jgi:phosphomevalonate kinase